MNWDPNTISVIALAISILSFIVSVFSFNLDRKIQYAQMVGEACILLTSRGVEVLTYIKKLEIQQTKESAELIEKLVRLAKVIVDVRASMKQCREMPAFLSSFFLVPQQDIHYELKEGELIFEELARAIDANNLNEANGSVDGLLMRFFGGKSAK